MSKMGLMSVEDWKDGLYRGSVATLSAVTVLGVLMLSVWVNLSENRDVCPNQGRTRESLQRFTQMLEEYRGKDGSLPKSLIELPGFSSLPANQRIDRWNRPFQYHPHEQGAYELFSLGRDGSPGGVGFDADLYQDKREGRIAKPTLEQFFWTFDRREVRPWGFWGAGLAAAALTFCTVFQSLGFQSSNRHRGRNWNFDLIGTIIVVVLACGLGLLLMPLHIPNGH